MREFTQGTAGAMGIPETEVRSDEGFVDYGRSVWVGVLIGTVIGAVLGVVLLAYIGSPKLNHWEWAFTIPMWSAVGWALFGMIVGSSGIFSKLGRRK